MHYRYHINSQIYLFLYMFINILITESYMTYSIIFEKIISNKLN